MAGCKSPLVLLLYASVSQKTTAFIPERSPIPARPAHFSPTTRTSLLPRHALSLDDSWDEVALRVNQAAAKIDWRTLEKQFAALQWKQFLSKEWFVHVFETTDKLQAYWSASVPAEVRVALYIFTFLSTFTILFSNLSNPRDTAYRAGQEPYVRGNSYDPIQARAFYSKRPYLVAQRMAQILRLSNRFLWNLALDKYLWRRTNTNPARAQELLDLVTELGPTAIKVGQALSVRPDLIPAEYASALSSLQDQVPPFESRLAKQVLQEQLGVDRYQRLKGLGLDGSSGGPVASASIGQVYKGTLERSDTQESPLDIAVKIQRPNVLAEIALDLYIVREFAPIYQRFTGGGTDLQSLADEWGRGFIAELDYRLEATNTRQFTEEMQKRNLNAVCAPTVLSEYSTEQVLVTEWVDGTRIDQSTEDDIPRLCSVALNAYLIMLLELQSLHCDPHPGNLLRTRDGRLCILDFGMTLDVDPNLQYSLLEFVAHLTADNFELLPDDLVNIGFLKPEKLEFAKRSGVLEPLKYFFRQAGKGGGAKAVRERIFAEYRDRFPGKNDDELRLEMRAEMKQNLADIVERESLATGITLEVEELQRQNRDAFRIPQWFLYTSRAFLTLEGVSLQADENYSIIQSCFPYVAKRLVADDDPRARKALRDLIYGATENVDVDRLSELAEGFSSYTSTTKSLGSRLDQGADTARARKQKLQDTENRITLVKDSADILLARDGNFVQNLLVEESALAVSARFKDSVRSAFIDGPESLRKSLPFGSALPPLPLEGIVDPFVRKTSSEEKAQALADKFLGSVVASSLRSDSNEELSSLVTSLRAVEPEQAALTLKEIRENVPRYSPLVGQLGGKFVSTLLRTANMNIESALKELDESGRYTDPLLRSTVKTLSSMVEEGSKAISEEEPVELE